MKTYWETGVGPSINLKVNDKAYVVKNSDRNINSTFMYVPTIKD